MLGPTGSLSVPAPAIHALMRLQFPVDSIHVYNHVVPPGEYFEAEVAGMTAVGH